MISVRVINPDSGQFIDASALLDTGASQSVIASRIATALQLPRMGTSIINTVTGWSAVPSYEVDLDFSSAGLGTRLATLEMAEISHDVGVDVILGTDIMCDMSRAQLVLGPGRDGTFDI